MIRLPWSTKTVPHICDSAHFRVVALTRSVNVLNSAATHQNLDSWSICERRCDNIGAKLAILLILQTAYRTKVSNAQALGDSPPTLRAMWQRGSLQIIPTPSAWRGYGRNMRNQSILKLSIGAGLCAAFLVGSAHAAAATHSKPQMGGQKKVIYTIKKNSAGSKKGSAVVALSAEGGCMPDSEVVCVPPDEATEIYSVTYELPKQEINGRAMDDGWTTICSGMECIGFELQEAKNATDDENSHGAIKEAIIRYSEVRDKTENACSSVAAIGSSATANMVSNTTSQSSTLARDVAAKAIWNESPQRIQLARDFASLAPSTWLDKYGYAADGGYTLTITYSDGGTEKFKVIMMNGSGDLSEPLPGTLVAGTGVSQCPKS